MQTALTFVAILCIIQDLRMSQEEDEQFCEEKHEIEEQEIQIN